MRSGSFIQNLQHPKLIDEFRFVIQIFLNTITAFFYLLMFCSVQKVIF